jgi:putative ABC transport system permease protein
LPRADEIHVDVRALVFTLGLALVVALVLGLVPVLRNSDKDLHAALNQSSRGQSANAVSRYLRSLLVVSQVALTLMLLIGAGLLGRSFLQLLKVDPGFRPESAVAMDVSLAFPETDAEEQRLSQFHQQVFERLGQIPGVSAVGGIDGLPMTSVLSNGTFLIDNDKSRPGEAEFRVASGGYFATLGIPLMQGRVFDERDTPTAPHAAIISQSLAQRYFADTNPIGQRIQFGNMDGYLQLLNVVGVVGDVRDRGLEARIAPTVYVNYVQRPRRSADFSIVARAQTNAPSLIAAMRSEVQALNRDVPMNFRTVEQIFSSSLDNRRFSLVLFGFFAVAGLLLAVTGIYGVMAYAVAERTREIGIRRALGAQAGDVLKLIIGQGMKLMLIGVAIGLAGAVALTRLIASWLFGVGATDPVTFIAVALLLAAVALLACYIPARRATKVDPMVALRYE